MANGEMIVIDVRTPSEYSGGHVAGAQNIDIMSADFIARIQKLDKQKTYKVYCRSGNRSGQAEALMKTLGFTDVENLGSVQEASQKLQVPCE